MILPLEQLAQGTGNLSYRSYCIGRVAISRYGTFIFSTWRYYFIQNFVTYILEGSIKKSAIYIYVQIKYSDILQCQQNCEHSCRSGTTLRNITGKKSSCEFLSKRFLSSYSFQSTPHKGSRCSETTAALGTNRISCQICNLKNMIQNQYINNKHFMVLLGPA